MTTSKAFNTQRKRVHISALQKYRKGGSVLVDYRRSRPRWFDGRFLKAADLNRESTYFLTRQADLAVASGTGVVEGLMVSESGAGRLRIEAGYGMTFDGERVFLPSDVEIAVHNIPLAEQLNADLGLSKKPAPPLRSLSGIYILALRALSFTANPTASYPVDVEGRRQLKDGDIIEATAITLVPYESPVGVSLFSQKSDQSVMAFQRRAQIAHSIFTELSPENLPGATLPLAMLDLRRGAVHWVDNHMVRRDMGAVHSDVLGFGFVPRYLRHAHFKQHDTMIGEIMADRPDARFAASEYFTSLPSAGRMPTAAIDMSTLTQYYFPESMDVEMSIIPEDELATLVEESLLLPPIPLTGAEDELAAHAVMIFLPVPRQAFYSMTKTLKKTPAPVSLQVKPVRSLFKPKDYIERFRAKLPDFTVPERKSEAALAEVGWQTLLAGRKNLWYIRRRNLNYKDTVTGTAVHVMTNEFQDETDMRRFQRGLNLYDDFTHLKVRGSAAADLEMVRLLTIPKFTAKRTGTDNAPQILMRAALKEFGDTKKLDERHAATVSLRYADRNMGKGIQRCEKLILTGNAANKANMAAKLSDALCVPEVDAIARALSDPELETFSAELAGMLTDNTVTPKQVAAFVQTKKEELES